MTHSLTHSLTTLLKIQLIGLNMPTMQNMQNMHRVAEVAQGHGGPPPKSLDSDENFKPEHMLFCRELIFVAIYALFGDVWAK